jgi:hypothetical protein
MKFPADQGIQPHRRQQRWPLANPINNGMLGHVYTTTAVQLHIISAPVHNAQSAVCHGQHITIPSNQGLSFTVLIPEVVSQLHRFVMWECSWLQILFAYALACTLGGPGK